MASSAKPIGDTLIELIRLPKDIADEILPTIKEQVREIPAIIRENGKYMADNVKELPESIRQSLMNEARENNLPFMFVQAASPIPLLDPKAIAEKIQAQQAAHDYAAKQQRSSVQPPADVTAPTTQTVKK